MLVRGHTLRSEGRPHNSDGTWSRDWSGRGMCSCGELSEPLSTDASRKRWHKEHKAAVLALNVTDTKEQLR